MNQFNNTKGVSGSKTLAESIIRSRVPEKYQEQVAHRLKVLDHAKKFGIRSTIDAFNISERTIKYWRASLRKNHGVLTGLVPKSTRPFHTRESKIPEKVRKYIRDTKKSFPKLGKEKIATLVAKDCNYVVSAGTVWNIIMYYRTRGMLPEKVRYSLHGKTGNMVVKKPRKRKVKTRRKEYTPDHPGDLIQLDTVVLMFHGKRYYILTAIDILTRIAYAQATTSHSSLVAKTFLEVLPTVFQYDIRRVQTDNGSEFAKYFDEACMSTGITHFWNYPRNPKQNAFIERFNRTIQEEWLPKATTLFLGDDMGLVNQDLSYWLTWYNTVRPHWGLHLEAPREYTNRIIN